MASASEEAKRPLAIVVLCFFLFVGSVGMLFFMRKTLAAYDDAHGYPSWFFTYTEGLDVAQIIAGIGIWRLRRWGFFLLAGTLLLSQVMIVSVGKWSVGSLIMGAFLLALARPGWQRAR